MKDLFKNTPLTPSASEAKGKGVGMRFKIILILIILFFVGIISCKQGKRTSPKINSPPVIMSANIVPDKPTRENDLNVIIESQDSDDDSVSFHYKWIKNDEEMPFENMRILRSGVYRKGDVVKVKVVASDGKADGSPILSSAVRIVNSSPVIQEVSIEPRVATVNDNLRTSIKSSDADGDFVYYSFQWEKNGVILSEEKGEILEKGRFRKGDIITVTVTPDDRESTGRPVKSEPIFISNSPPLIVSEPPAFLKGATYIYPFKANDPDDDPIYFILKSGPKGMEIDKDTGLIKWEIRKEDRGSHFVEIEASDNSGAKGFQRYTLMVNNY